MKNLISQFNSYLLLVLLGICFSSLSTTVNAEKIINKLKLNEKYFVLCDGIIQNITYFSSQYFNMPKKITFISHSVEIKFSTGDTICNNITTNLCAKVTNGVGPFNFQWSFQSRTDSCVTVNISGTYSVTVTDLGNNNETANSSAMVIVLPEVNYGAIASGDETICNGGDPANIIFSTAPSGGQGTFTYQWYYQDGLPACPSGASTLGWTIIPGETKPSYNPSSGLTSSRTYAVVVDATGTPDCGGPTWATSCRKITVVAKVDYGTVASGDETICNGGDPANIIFSSGPTGGQGTFTYQWYYQDGLPACPIGTSTLGWNIIPGETNANYDPPSGLTVSRTYAVVVDATGLPDCGGPVWSTSCRKITVVTKVDYGTVAIGDELICNGGDPANIIFSTAPSGGHGAFTYEWYYQDGLASCPSGTSTLGWTMITGETKPSYDPPMGVTVSRTYAVIVDATGSPDCWTPTWATACRKVTVYKKVDFGTLAPGDETICNGGDPANIIFSSGPSGGQGTFKYQWYYQDGLPTCPFGTSTIGWNIILGETNANYDPPSGLANSRTYALQVDATGTPDCGAATWVNGCRKVTVLKKPIPKLIIKDLGNIKSKIISDTSLKVNGIISRTIRIYKDGKREMPDIFQKEAFFEYRIDFMLGSRYKICLIIEDANSCSDSTCTEFMISSLNCNDVISIKETSELKNRCLNDTTKLDLIIKPSNKFTDSLSIVLYANDSVYSNFFKKSNTDTIYQINYLNKKCDKINFRAKIIGKIGGGKIDTCYTADDPEIKVNCLPIKKLLIDNYCFNQNDPTANIQYKFNDIDNNNLAKNNKPFKVRVNGDSFIRDADTLYSLPFVIQPDFNNFKNTISIIWEFIRNDSTQCQISNDTDIINLYLRPKIRKIDTTACQGTKLSIPLGYVINRDLDFKWKSSSVMPWNINKLIDINPVLIGTNTYQYIILNNLSGSLMCGDSGIFTVSGKESPKIKIVEIDKCIGFYKAEITNQSQPDKLDWLPHGDDPRIDSIKRDLIRIIPNNGLLDSLCSTAKLGTCIDTNCIKIDPKLISDTTEAQLSKIDCKDSTLIFTKQIGCYRWISINTHDNSWEVIDSKNAYIIRDSNFIKEHLIVLRTFPCDDTSKCGNYELFIRSQNTESDCNEHINGSINFYPNPTAGILTLSFENLINGHYSVKIYNAIGNRVYDNALIIDNHNLINKINLNENLPAGIYHILIENNYGNYWLKNIAVIR